MTTTSNVLFSAAALAGVVQAQDTCFGKSAGQHTIAGVTGVYCDGDGQALIQNVDRSNSCSVLGYTEISETNPQSCGYLSDAAVRAIAAQSFDVTLVDIGRGSAYSTNDVAIEALRNGDNWHSAMWSSTGWEFEIIDFSILSNGWPNMIHSNPTNINSVFWIGETGNGFLPSRTHEIPPQGSQTWLDMNPSIESCEGRSAGFYRVADVRRVYCDGNGFALIQNHDLASDCAGNSESSAIALQSCGFVSEPDVQILANRSYGVKLVDVGRSSVQSLNGALTALKTGGNWQQGSTTWTNGWSFVDSCNATNPSTASGWPNVIDGCGSTNGVNWQVANGAIPSSDGGNPPTASRTLLDMNTPLSESQLAAQLNTLAAQQQPSVPQNTSQTVMTALEQNGMAGLTQAEQQQGSLQRALDATYVQDFAIADTNRDGEVTLAELAVRRNIDEAQAQQLLDAASVSAPLNLASLSALPFDTMPQAFDTADADNTGLITPAELQVDLAGRLGRQVSLGEATTVLNSATKGTTSAGNNINGLTLAQYESLPSTAEILNFIDRDTNDDGVIDATDLENLIAQSASQQVPSPSSATAVALMAALDTTGDSQLNTAEAAQPALDRSLDPTVVQDFALADTDRSGEVSVAELAARREISDVEAQALIGNLSAPLDLTEYSTLSYVAQPQAFDTADADNTGLITAQELQADLTGRLGTSVSLAEANAVLDASPLGTTDQNVNDSPSRGVTLAQYEGLPADAIIAQFVARDSDDNGQISRGELGAAAVAQGGTTASGEQLLTGLDGNSDEQLSFVEYLNGNATTALGQPNVIAFAAGDTDRDGLVSAAEFAAQKGVSEEAAREHFIKVTGDENPQNLGEFLDSNSREVSDVSGVVDGAVVDEGSSSRSLDGAGLIGTIVGSVLGCCLLLLLLLLCLWCCCFRKKKAEEEEEERKYVRTTDEQMPYGTETVQEERHAVDVQPVRELTPERIPSPLTENTREVPVTLTAATAVAGATAGAAASSKSASSKSVSRNGVNYNDDYGGEERHRDSGVLMVRTRNGVRETPSRKEETAGYDVHSYADGETKTVTEMPTLRMVAESIHVPVSELHKQNHHVANVDEPLPDSIALEVPALKTSAGTNAKLRSYAKKTKIPLGDLADENKHITDHSIPVPDDAPVYIPYSTILAASHGSRGMTTVTETIETSTSQEESFLTAEF